MGYTTRNNGLITDYWPDDNETTMYISEDVGSSLANIIQYAKDKWGDQISFDEIEIKGEKIHTSCIYYDLYDSRDYTNFVVISRIKTGE